MTRTPTGGANAKHRQTTHCSARLFGVSINGAGVDVRRRVVPLAGFVVVVGGALALALSLVAETGPVHYMRCVIEGGGGGWIIELPREAQDPADVQRFVREQTACVPVEIGYVNWGLVEDGRLAEPISDPRRWVRHGESVRIWVEGREKQASDPCAPARPRTAPPPGCPGGVQPLR